MDNDGRRTDPDPMVTVATALRRARAATGLSQDELGERIGESGATISRWENAKRDIKIEYVVRIEQALDLPRGYIWREAGLCEPCEDVESAIRSDSALSSAARDALVGVYRTLLRQLPASPADVSVVAPPASAEAAKKVSQSARNERRARRK